MPRPERITSIDALRGLVMFTMIYVNDIAGAGRIVPDWMVHFSDRHREGSGMTFVDLVFPAFLFIVGMSIPFALGARLKRGEPRWRLLGHVAARTAMLLLIGVLMVNEWPDAEKMGWSPALWCTLMYLSAIAACGAIAPPAAGEAAARIGRNVSLALRLAGFVALGWLAFAFVGADGHRIVTLSPFAIHHEWWGILGLIGWAYLTGAVVFLVFRGNRAALLGCMVLLICLYPAERGGLFDGWWVAAHVGLGGTLGSHASITVGGVLLASILLAPEMTAVRARVGFAVLFAAGTAAAAVLLARTFGISKNEATPPWCLWSCAITALVWLVFYYVADVRRWQRVARPFAVAGQNVLLAYLLSDLLPSLLSLLHLGDVYARLAGPDLINAMARASGCGVVLLAATAGLNRVGFRLKI